MRLATATRVHTSCYSSLRKTFIPSNNSCHYRFGCQGVARGTARWFRPFPPAEGRSCWCRRALGHLGCMSPPLWPLKCAESPCSAPLRPRPNSPSLRANSSRSKPLPTCNKPSAERSMRTYKPASNHSLCKLPMTSHYVSYNSHSQSCSRSMGDGREEAVPRYIRARRAIVD